MGINVGDLVFINGDPDSPEYVLEVSAVVREGTGPTQSGRTVRVRAWGTRTPFLHDGCYYAYQLQKATSVQPGTLSPLPCSPFRGLDASTKLDFSLAHAAADAAIEAQRKYRAGGTAELHANNQAKEFAWFLFAAYPQPLGRFDGEPVGARTALEEWRNTEARYGGGYSSLGSYLNSRYSLVLDATESESVQQAVHDHFVRIMCCARDIMVKQTNRDTEVPALCLSCAIVHGISTAQGEGSCNHYTCSRCMTDHTGASCEVCRVLRYGHSSDVTRHVCPDCCSHSRCGVCETNVLRDRLCDICSDCLNCCECPTCASSGCDGRDLQTCCGYCSGHCECESSCMPRVSNPLTKYHAESTDRSKLKRLIGTELEILTARRYSESLRDAVSKWRCNIVSDGSIASDDGMELVTQPAGGARWEEMIADIGNGFKDSGSVVGGSCGQHVHVDAGDLNVWDLRRLVKLYAYVEMALFDALPVDRVASRFCAPCGGQYEAWLVNMGSKPSKKGFKAAQYGLSLPRKTKQYPSGTRAENREFQERASVKAEHKYDKTRYRALNLHSYWHRGTIEFRHAHGTTNPEQITRWGQVCCAIVEFAAKGSDAQLSELLKLKPRDVVLAILAKFDLVPASTWLRARWAKFTKADGTRKTVQRDEHGEV